MTMRVVPEACEFESSRMRGRIVIESDISGPPFTLAFDELRCLEARQLAQQFANEHGVMGALINGNVEGPYPVNVEGVPLDMVRGPKGEALSQAHVSMQPARYRVTVPVHQRTR